MLKIGIIGSGNCGNVIASAAAELHGFDVVLLNSSEADIAAIKNKALPIVQIADGKGFGQDRNFAKAYLSDDSNMSDIITNKEIVDLCNKNDVIVVVGSTGGSTGSALVPVTTRALDFIFGANKQDKKALCVGVLPKNSDGINCLRNAAAFAVEIDENDITYTLFDNNAVDGTHGETLEKVNMSIIEMLRFIRGDFSYVTSDGMIDDRDMLTMLRTSGFFTFNQLRDWNFKDADIHTIDEMMIASIKKSPACAIERNKNSMHAMGILFAISPDVAKVTKSDFSELKAFTGVPSRDFRHFAIGEYDENLVCTLMTGMSFPNTRFGEISNLVVEYDKNKKEQGRSDASLKDIIASSNEQSQDAPKSLDDVLKGFLK